MLNLSQETLKGFSLALSQEITNDSPVEKLAWAFFLLRTVPEEPKYFPKGKWASIQALEDQLTSHAFNITA